MYAFYFGRNKEGNHYYIQSGNPKLMEGEITPSPDFRGARTYLLDSLIKLKEHGQPEVNITYDKLWNGGNLPTPTTVTDSQQKTAHNLCQLTVPEQKELNLILKLYNN